LHAALLRAQNLARMRELVNNSAMNEDSIAAQRAHAKGGSPGEVLAVFSRLGVSCFGGPIAHLG
jgi:hypothetical protein